MDNLDYINSQIKEQEKIIAAATEYLDYLTNYKFLCELQESAEVKVIFYLVSYYGATVKCFRYDNLSDNRHVTSNKFSTVKNAISSYKSMSDTQLKPSWAAKAMKAAKIVDAFLNKKQ